MAESKLGTAYVAIRATLEMLDEDLAKARSKVEQGLSGAFAKVGPKVTAAGAAVTAGLTLPILAVGAAVLNAGAQFDEALDTIRTTTGATGDKLKGLGEDVKGVFTSIPTTMPIATQAIAELNARTGQTGAGLQELAKAEIELARITGGDLASQIQNTTRMFGDWGIAVKDQVPSLDALMRAHQATGIGVDTLAAKLVQFGAPLRQMGFDFETSAALIGKFEKEGVNTELVLGSMRIALGKFAKAGIEPKEGLRLLVKGIQEAGSTADANKMAIEAFGARAGPDMAAAIREGRFSVDELYNSIANGKDTVLGAAADTNDYAEKFTILKNKVTTAAIPLGVTLFNAINSLMPVFEKVIGFVAGLIEKFSNLPSGVQTGILAFVALLAAIGPIATVIGGIITIVGTLGPIFAAVGVAIGAALGPVLLIVAAVALVVGALYLAWKNNFLGIQDVVKVVWEKIKEIFGKIKEIVGAVMDFINGKITFEEMKAKVAAAWEGIKNAVASGIERIKEIVGPAWERIKELAAAAWEGIKAAIAEKWDAIKTAVAEKVEAIRAAIAEKWDAIKTSVAEKVEAIRAAIAEKWDAIKTAVAEKVEAVRTAIAEKFESIRSTVAEKVEAARATVAEKWDAISTKISAVLETIKGAVGPAVQWIVDKLAEIGAKIAEAWAKLTGKGEAAGPTITTPEEAAALTAAINALTMAVNASNLAWQGLQATITTVMAMFTTLPVIIAATWLTIQTQTLTTWTAIQLTLLTITTALLAMFTLWLTTLQVTMATTWLAVLTDTILQWTTLQAFLVLTTATLLALFTLWLVTLKTQIAATWLEIQANSLLTWQTIQLDLVTLWTAIQLFMLAITTQIKTETLDNYKFILGGYRGLGQELMMEVEMTWGIIYATVVANAQAMKEGAIAAAQEMESQIMAILNGMAGQARAAGAALARAFGDGIRSELESALDDARRLAAEIRALLPGSDAETGPLSDLTASGKALPLTLAQGMLSGSGVLGRAAAALAAVGRPMLEGAGPGASALGGGQEATWWQPGDLQPKSGTQPVPGQSISVTINNPVGEPAEVSMVRQLRNLSYVGMLG